WAHGDYLRTWKGGANNLLPWTANVSFAVTQDHNHGSHLNFDRWAWDFGTPVGTPILAAHFGTVRLVRGDSARGGCSSSFGGDANYVVIDQGNGYESLYLHLESVTVAKGQLVERGDLIGYSGQTGWSCGAHLHFAIQLSPTNGGGAGWYNPSIHDYFYDPGFAFDPAEGTVVKSQNGVSNQP
ncbi:MAG TPA: M23 family metallopeptidase, partial [Kofleriaceae bacterium]